MIQIIPNWHPVFVHFSVALLATSALFYLAAFLPGRWDGVFLSVARVNLFTGFAITIATVIAGFLAYNSVLHDDPSHVAMTDHRNWALAATAVWAASAAWEAWRAWQGADRSFLVLIVLLIGTALLGVTGFKGGELVFRHGLGVQSLPNADHHQHPGGGSGGTATTATSAAPESTRTASAHRTRTARKRSAATDWSHRITAQPQRR